MAEQRDSIRVTGLSEFVAAVKDGDAAWARELSKSFRNIAKMIQSGAQGAAMGQGGVSAHVASGIRASGTTKGASIKLDVSAQPAILGAEFGGGRYGAGKPTARGGHTTQFKNWTGRSADAGYFVYPTIRKQEPAIEAALMEAIDAVGAKAFPD